MHLHWQSSRCKGQIGIHAAVRSVQLALGAHLLRYVLRQCELPVHHFAFWLCCLCNLPEGALYADEGSAVIRQLALDAHKKKENKHLQMYAQRKLSYQTTVLPAALMLCAIVAAHAVCATRQRELFTLVKEAQQYDLPFPRSRMGQTDRQTHTQTNTVPVLIYKISKTRTRQNKIKPWQDY